MKRAILRYFSLESPVGTDVSEERKQCLACSFDSEDGESTSCSSDYVTSNYRMINDYLIEQDVGGAVMAWLEVLSHTSPERARDVAR
jgi:hypothetical protein